MSISFDSFQSQIAELTNTELEALAITVEKELKRRKQEEELRTTNGCYELKGIKSGNKVHYYWYLRYRQDGKLKSKYLGKGDEGDRHPPVKSKDKGSKFLEGLS